ncbi:interleukin-20 receptor subunit beta [Tachyglossus aculeatus]|uniref:interleukin-20 receptor subunit beta n=1 Tax=Tachyglossus aculeatus TaxID=9261 RepID=UPI0018F31747|nr:interleukin-20 receptor subunit beta [Tachyglossus aculeatus]
MFLKGTATTPIVVILCSLIPSLAADGGVFLPAPQNLSVRSTNMKHILIWSPVTVHGKSANYSVEFQGEYERYYSGHTWIPTSWCNSISSPQCNVTDDITATVAYNLRVRATLGKETSAWTTLEKFFNRNSTVLTPPKMKVYVDGYHLIVEVEDMGPSFEYQLMYWRKGHDAKVVNKTLREGGTRTHLETMEAGAEYCVRAQTVVEVIERRSDFNQMDCVRVPDEFLPLTLMLVSFAGFLVTLVTLPLLVWKMNQIFRYSCCPEVVLPNTLRLKDSPQKLINCKREEIEFCDTTVRALSPEDLFRAWIQETL